MKVFIAKRLVYDNAVALKNSLAKARGLMFSSRVLRPLVFFFSKPSRTGASIHSFFCPEFDAIFVSEDFVVTDVFSRVKPNAFFPPSRKALFLIETFPGDASRKGFVEGVKLRFE
ncbi:MAG: hypothetical protein ABH803_03335 [Candidatus Micrarchaeota archaeon]